MTSLLNRASPDHVAVAVPDLPRAAARWQDALGGGLLNQWDNGAFSGSKYVFGNGAKLELIAPSDGDRSPDNFVRAFLAKFGTRIHHVTLFVDDIETAIDTVRGGGYDLVDVRLEHEEWKEAFLRPSQAGGIVVQLAWSPRTEEEWARRRNFDIRSPRPDAAAFLGVVLRRPDLDAADELWQLLGAKTERDTDRLVGRWEDNPIEVVVERGEPTGPVALRFGDTLPLPAEDGLGPEVRSRSV